MTRKQAAKELQAVYNGYELRSITLSTVYRKIFKNGDAWRLIGHAHDYVV